MFDTRSCAVPDFPGGDEHSRSVGEMYVAALGTPAKLHARDGERAKGPPCTATSVPPRSNPREGAARDTDTGGSTCSPAPASVYGDPLLETRSEYSPGARGGAWHSSAVSERSVAVAGVGPRRQRAGPGPKPRPSTRTTSASPASATDGESDTTRGPAAKMKDRLRA